jgi:hypothetical protein
MTKHKTFDAVEMMRTIRDRMSEEMEGMTSEQRIDYIKRQAGHAELEGRSAGHPRGTRARRGRPHRAPVPVPASQPTR